MRSCELIFAFHHDDESAHNESWVSFNKLIRNEKEVEIWTSHFSINDFQPSHHIISIMVTLTRKDIFTVDHFLDFVNQSVAQIFC